MSGCRGIKRNRYATTHGRIMRAAMAAAAAAGAIPVVASADATWKGSVTAGNWNSGANWLGGVVPASGDNVLINQSDAVNRTITYDAAFVSNLALQLNNNGGGTDTFNQGPG